MSETPFVLAVPSKGRLQDNAFAFFARAGLKLVQGRGVRDYRGTLEGVEGVEVAFVSASEIVALLASGQAHMGITGEDLIRETLLAPDAKVALLTKLGFGAANVVVAVPQAWIDVKTMADLEDVAAAFYARRGERMRVATKYINLTRRFFAESHVTDYRIVESLGATEGAPAAGLAELIVDITTTGATLAANALKVLDDGIILRSEANLVAGLGAPWDARARDQARQILGQIAAEQEGRLTRDVTAQFDRMPAGMIEDAARLFATTWRSENGTGCLTLTCARDKVALLARWLMSHGAGRVTAGAHDYVFSADNPLYQALSLRLPE